MKTILISTSSLWNCGDDFIREGVLNLLQLKDNINTLWWNRGYGITNTYANSLDVNLSLTDYFIVAGTPQWIYKNIYIYKYCLKHDIPFSLIGVGTSNLYKYHIKLLKHLAKSNLCEIALARDIDAYNVFKEVGFKNIGLMIDPAFFMEPLKYRERKINVLGWRQQFWTGSADYPLTFYFRYYKTMISKLKNYFRNKKKQNLENRNIYDIYFQKIFERMETPKLVIVHDNREVKKAKKLFGENNIFYSSNYKEMFKFLSKTKYYYGSRIHGAIPALIHGASINLIYTSRKANVLETSMGILENYNNNLKSLVNVKYWGKDIFENIDLNKNISNINNQETNLTNAINAENIRINNILKKQKVLSQYML